MDKRRWYLLIQTIVCILLAAAISITVVRIYRTGSARKAENPRESIYSREIVTREFAPLVPLLIGALCLSAAGVVLGIRDEKAGLPVTGRRGRPGKNARASDRDRSKEMVRAEEQERIVQPQRPGMIRAALVVVAVVFIIAGILNLSARDVFHKAAAICMECIGLG